MKTKKRKRLRANRTSPLYDNFIIAGRVIIDLLAFWYLVILLLFRLHLI